MTNLTLNQFPSAGPLTGTEAVYVSQSGVTSQTTAQNIANLAPSSAAGVQFTDGTHTVSGATKLTISGATVGGTSPNATLTVTAGSSGRTLKLSTYSGICLLYTSLHPSAVWRY